MAANETSLNTIGTQPDVVVQEPKSPRRAGRLTSFWKALIITSFAINLILIFVILFLVGFIIQWREQIVSTTVGAQGFARNNVAELRSAVEGLKSATINAQIPLDSVTIPVKLNVPVNQQTVVELTEPVAITVEGADISLGAAGQLRANVSLNLPAGTRLPINLNMTIPIDQPLPLQGQNVTVPVSIPLVETELYDDFVHLGNVVDRLAAPAAPILNLDIPEPPPAPVAPTAAPK